MSTRKGGGKRWPEEGRGIARGTKAQKRSAALTKSGGVFKGITPVSERGEEAPRAAELALGRRWPFGTPSTGLSLGGLLASRARLRFTRHRGCTQCRAGKQEQTALHDRQRLGQAMTA
jgi:hypothetical protein